MQSRLLILLTLTSLPCAAQSAEEQPRWSLELLIGDAYNADSRTRIKQQTVGNLSFTGDYDTRGMEGPLHYAWRIARWEDARGWELQLLHHKLFLQNRPAGIDALGAAALIGLGRKLELGANFYLLGEVSGTFGYIRAQPDGTPELEVTIRNPALHAQAGVGSRF